MWLAQDNFQMFRKTQRIVPIRDRRQSKRYLTLRNARNVGLALVAIFLIITIRSEMRDPQPGDYGRLFHKELPPAPVAKPMEIVREAPPAVPDHTAADPMLVEPMTRAQWLDGSFTADASSEPIQASATPPTVVAPVRGTDRVAIVGGPEGVMIVKETRKRGGLKGGFGR
jgi:hypothetical protein